MPNQPRSAYRTPEYPQRRQCRLASSAAILGCFTSSPSPGADVAEVSPSPGADVAGADLPKEVAVEAAQPVAPTRADRRVPDVRARERRSGSLRKPMHGVLGVLTGPLPPAMLRRSVPLWLVHRVGLSGLATVPLRYSAYP